jgi:hypothetical protein
MVTQPKRWERQGRCAGFLYNIQIEERAMYIGLGGLLILILVLWLLGVI